MVGTVAEEVGREEGTGGRRVRSESGEVRRCRGADRPATEPSAGGMARLNVGVKAHIELAKEASNPGLSSPLSSPSPSLAPSSPSDPRSRNGNLALLCPPAGLTVAPFVVAAGRAAAAPSFHPVGELLRRSSDPASSSSSAAPRPKSVERESGDGRGQGRPGTPSEVGPKEGPGEEDKKAMVRLLGGVGVQ